MDENRRTGVRVAGSRTTGIFHADYTMSFSQTNTDISGGEYFQQRPVYWNVLNTPAEVDLTNYKDIENNKFANHNGYFNAYYPNPYWQLNNSRQKTKAENVLGSALISVNPAKWIDISYRAGLTYNSRDYNTYRNGVTYNSFMQTDPWEAGHMATGSPFVGVSTGDIRNSIILTGDFLVQLNHKMGDFTGKLILGNSMYSNKYQQIGLDNNSLVIPELYNISNRLGEAGVHQETLNRNSIGLFADLTIGYKGYAYLHASARNDWDSRLTEENRSFFYPGVDASVILTEAIPSLKDNDFLNFLKIRGGWSKTGQISLDNWYATLPSFNPGTGNNSNVGFPYGSLGGFQLSRTLSNPLLKPEQTQEIEAGIETSFLNNRLHFDVTAYQSNTKDQTIPATISYATGYESAFINAGELQTQGIETDVRLTPLLNLGEFNWNLTVSYAYNTSEVISILPGLDELPIADVSYAIVGQQFPAIKVTDVKRDPEGHIIVDPMTGYPIKDPALKHKGHGNPNHILGIVNNFTYKGFNLGIVADYRSGNIIQNQVGNSLDFTGTSWHSAQNGRQNFVIPGSVIETAPGVYTPNTDVITRNASRQLWVSSDYHNAQIPYLTSAAFWKLRELSLSYDVPTANILGGAIKAAQLGIVGRNLIMLRPRTNVWTDPEFNTRSGNSNALGYTTEDQTPPTRVYGFSVKLTF